MFHIMLPSVMVNKRQGGHKIQSKGTFAGAVVKRGPDWDWGNQDGGPQEKGLVTDVKGWDNQTFHSVVSVTWVNSEGNVYRRGHKGKVNIGSYITYYDYSDNDDDENCDDDDDNSHDFHV